jgi:hypothetical protein
VRAKCAPVLYTCQVTTVVKGAVRLHIYMTGRHSQRAWYDCDCEASQIQLYGCDRYRPVRPPDYSKGAPLRSQDIWASMGFLRVLGWP